MRPTSTPSSSSTAPGRATNSSPSSAPANARTVRSPTDVADLEYLGGQDLGTLLDAEFEATEASLAAADRPSVRVELDRMDAESVGRLLFDVEAACILAGELYGVETFTQPAVEWGKNAARGLLDGGDFAEAEAVREKTELVVE